MQASCKLEGSYSGSAPTECFIKDPCPCARLGLTVAFLIFVFRSCGKPVSGSPTKPVYMAHRRTCGDFQSNT